MKQVIAPLAILSSTATITAFLLLVAMAPEAHADHYDPWCPDIHDHGDESLKGVTMINWAVQPDPAIVPSYTVLQMTGIGTATGSCDIWNYDPYPTCGYIRTELRAISRLNHYVTARTDGGPQYTNAYRGAEIPVDENGQTEFKQLVKEPLINSVVGG